jgi:hypothetical protein
MSKRKVEAVVRDGADQFERFHWGNPPKRIRKVRLSKRPRVLVEIGELVAVTYRTAKGATRRDDWIHEHSRPRPRLAYDAETGALHIVGGAYRITEEGIED